MAQHAHLVYHDVLDKLLPKESWDVRESNDAGSANGPTISKHCKHVRISQDFLVSSVLLNGILHGLAAPQFDTLKIKQTPWSDIVEPRIWGLKSFSIKKPKVSQFVNGDHSRTPACTEG